MLSPLPVKTVIKVQSDTVKCEKSNGDDMDGYPARIKVESLNLLF